MIVFAPQLITAGLMALGALIYNLWGFYKAWAATQDTPEQEKFDWGKFGTTIIPSVVAGFIAGYALPATGTIMAMEMVVNGFALAAAQGQLGIKNFFD